MTEEKDNKGEEKKLLPLNYDLHKISHLNLTEHYLSLNFTDREIKLKEAKFLT